MEYRRKSDGALVAEAEAMSGSIVRDGYSRTIGPGDHVGFDVMMMDSRTEVRDDAFLFDAAGKLGRLIDAATGAPAPFTLNADLIAAMEAEADKLGLSMKRYLGEVLNFSVAYANLTTKEGTA